MLSSNHVFFNCLFPLHELMTMIGDGGAGNKQRLLDLRGGLKKQVFLTRPTPHTYMKLVRQKVDWKPLENNYDESGEEGEKERGYSVL